MENHTQPTIQEIAEKAYHAQTQTQGSANPGLGTIGKALHEPCRASLRERVESQLYRARQERIKAEHHLEELSYLLDKHPDFARILDLLEEVRG